MSELRDRLFAAATEELAGLCERYRDEIVAEFRDWLVVPEPLRGDPTAVQAIGGALIRIAERLAGAGELRPLAWLGGEDREDPVERWHATLTNGQALTESGRADAAVGVLRALLEELEGAMGWHVDDLTARAQGALSAALLALGDIGGARAYARAALERCVASVDLDGIRIYAENLDLLDALDGGPDLDVLREGLAEAQNLSDDGRYAASNEILYELARRGGGGRYGGKLRGLVGLNLFRIGELDGAREWTVAALQVCDAARDLHGMTIYTENLRVIDAAAQARAR